MMGESIQQCSGAPGITKYIGPFREAQVGRDNNTGPFIELADQMKEQCATSRLYRKHAFTVSISNRG